MESLKQVLMRRDGMTSEEADEAIAACKEDMMARIGEGELPFDILEEHFGLEPDYLEELL